jgi:hypothetical protein
MRAKTPTTMPTQISALPQRLLIGLVRGYRLLLSPWLGSSCRFEPTCSAYALDALDRHGAAAGSYLTLHRIGRCHPWCAGGIDPVPTRAPRPFSCLASRVADPAPPSHPTGKIAP